MNRTIFTLVLFFWPVFASAQCDLDSVVGYTLVASKTVVARIDNGVRSDGFEGCSFGRVLVFEDGTGLVCQGYNYTYAYRPTAYLFVNGVLIKGCIEGELTDLSPIR